MENNFNNEEMMNNGFEAINTFENHKSMTNGQIAAMVIIGSVICAGVFKGADWLKKRKRAKKQVEVIYNFENGRFETSDRKVICIFKPQRL